MSILQSQLQHYKDFSTSSKVVYAFTAFTGALVIGFAIVYLAVGDLPRFIFTLVQGVLFAMILHNFWHTEVSIIESRKKEDLRKQREDARETARLQALTEQEAAAKDAAFQSAIRNFCHGSANDYFWGIRFHGWKSELDALVKQGLSLDNPSPDFDALLTSVQHSVDYNQACANRANDPAFDDKVRASLAFGIPYCLHASQSCLQHLLDIQNGWYEKATAPAIGSSKPKGRL